MGVSPRGRSAASADPHRRSRLPCRSETRQVPASAHGPNPRQARDGGIGRSHLGDSASDGYSARPRSGRPLFGEAIAREGLCGPWRRSQCRRGGADACFHARLSRNPGPDHERLANHADRLRDSLAWSRTLSRQALR
jgi:hypothetical protein